MTQGLGHVHGNIEYPELESGVGTVAIKGAPEVYEVPTSDGGSAGNTLRLHVTPVSHTGGVPGKIYRLRITKFGVQETGKPYHKTSDYRSKVAFKSLLLSLFNKVEDPMFAPPANPQQITPEETARFNQADAMLQQMEQMLMSGKLDGQQVCVKTTARVSKAGNDYSIHKFSPAS
jgi:hypothetical protein